MESLFANHFTMDPLNCESQTGSRWTISHHDHENPFNYWAEMGNFGRKVGEVIVNALNDKTSIT